MGKAKKKKKTVQPAPMKPRRLPPFTPLFYVATLALTYAVYNGVVDNYLFNDDFVWLSKARHDMGGNVLSYRVIGFFRPFINLSFFATERLVPGNLPAYYLGGLLLHWVNAILLYYITLTLLRDRLVAAATAVYFLVASFHFGAVAWISARTTLFSSFFLLLSLVLLLRTRASRARTIGVLALYVLTLASKETAVAGLFLVGLIYVFTRKRRDVSLPASTVAAFAAITVVYLIVRRLVVGGFVQDNWGPGFHAVSNLSGAVVFQYYSLALALLPSLGASSLATAPAWVDYLAFPVIAALLALARLSGRLREVGFAISWTILSLLPVALWKFRFFASDSIPHTRYYYLSSFGVCLSIVVLLGALWQARRARRAAMALAAGLFVVVCITEVSQVRALERRWDTVTGEYRMIVSIVERELDRVVGLDVCVIENPPILYPYLEGALRLERPQWRFVEGDGTRALAQQNRPCLHLRFLYRGDQFRIAAERLE